MAVSALRKLPVQGSTTILLHHSSATAVKSLVNARLPNKAILATVNKMGKSASFIFGQQQLLAESLEKVISAADNMQAFAEAY